MNLKKLIFEWSSEIEIENFEILKYKILYYFHFFKKIKKIKLTSKINKSKFFNFIKISF